MVAMPSHSVLAVLLSDTGGECVPTLPEETTPAPTAEPPVCEEWDGERDLGSLDLPEEYEEMYERGFYHPYG